MIINRICFLNGNEEVWMVIPTTNGKFMASTWSRIKKTKTNQIIHGHTRKSGRNMIGMNGKTRARAVWLMMTFRNFKPDKHSIIVDHIDGNPENDSLENLQAITHQQNIAKSKNGKSKYTGLSWNKSKNLWYVRVSKNKDRIGIGYFKDEYQAHLAYQKAFLSL